MNLVIEPITNKESGQCTYQKQRIWSVHLLQTKNLARVPKKNESAQRTY